MRIHQNIRHLRTYPKLMITTSYVLWFVHSMLCGNHSRKPFIPNFERMANYCPHYGMNMVGIFLVKNHSCWINWFHYVRYFVLFLQHSTLLLCHIRCAVKLSLKLNMTRSSYIVQISEEWKNNWWTRKRVHICASFVFQIISWKWIVSGWFQQA